MLTWILFIAMFVAGIVALVTGKMNVSRTKVARGVPARLAGVVLMLPFPLALVIGIIALVLMSSGGQPPNANSFQTVDIAITLGSIVFCFVVAMLIAGLNAVPKDDLAGRPGREEEDYADEGARPSPRERSDRIRRGPDDRIQE
jgi:hypothetical protein